MRFSLGTKRFKIVHRHKGRVTQWAVICPEHGEIAHRNSIEDAKTALGHHIENVEHGEDN